LIAGQRLKRTASRDRCIQHTISSAIRKPIAGRINTSALHTVPGENDAALDGGVRGGAAHAGAQARIKGWSFEETEHEVRKNLVYRHLARVYFERVPDAKTLIRLSAAIGADGIEATHCRLVEMAREQGLVRSFSRLAGGSS
jgi:hypothetical protein